MGSYCEPRSNGVDARAGTLVWVRRPNGSWWPGVVMEPDELPERRKGMPVKLLGREDGALDWYNLEKSMRIKAFRCGEYDWCIEKAQDSALRSKKTNRMGKYARREDAILHALDLEKAYYYNGDARFNLVSGMKHVSQKGNFSEPFKEQDYVSERYAKGKVTAKLSQSSSLLQHATSMKSCKTQAPRKRRLRTQNDFEEDCIEGKKRMRGLLDIGSGARSGTNVEEVSPCQHPLLDTAPVSESNMGNSFSSINPANSCKDSCPSKKRTMQVVRQNEIMKRRNRSRPLSKVLESTARVVIPSLGDQKDSSPQSRYMQITSDSPESKKTEFSMVINHGSGSTCDEALDTCNDTCRDLVDQDFFLSEMTDDELLNALPDGSGDSLYDLFDVPIFMEENSIDDSLHMVTHWKDTSMLEQRSTHCNEVPQTTQNTDTSIAQFSDTRKKSCKSLSKQNVKAKRNSKFSTMSNKDNTSHATVSHSKGRSDKMMSMISNKDKGDSCFSNKMLVADKVLQPVSCGFVTREMENQSVKQSPEMFVSAYSSDEQESGCKQTSVYSKKLLKGNDNNATDCERHNESLVTRIVSNFHEESRISDEFLSDKAQDRSCTGSYLYEVSVDVEAGYKGINPPLVSLKSKLYRKAIIGHPISVMVMEGSSCDAYIDYSCPKGDRRNLDNGDVLPKKRSAIVNVPLLQDSYGCEIGRLPPQRNGYSSKSHSQTKKSSSDHVKAQTRSRKKKPSKNRKSGFLSRKIRKLSSITIDRECKTKKSDILVEKCCITEGACVPVKLVFNRISEALSLPS